MRIFVTNDDGIDSVGLHVLARALTEVGDVTVVAPDREYSGSSASLGVLHEMRPEIHRAHLDGVPAAWSVSAPPAMCAVFTRMGTFDGPPDLVVSGINPGANTGRAVYHSGTVGAAVTARNGGINAIAVSQAVEIFEIEGQGWGDQLRDQRWEAAAEVAVTVAARLLDDLPDDPVCVNLNVPNTPVAEMRGWRKTGLAHYPSRAIVSANLTPKAGHEGAFEAELSWGEELDLPIDTDAGAVDAGYVSVTYLSRYQDEARTDLYGCELALDELLDA